MDSFVHKLMKNIKLKPHLLNFNSKVESVPELSSLIWSRFTKEIIQLESHLSAVYLIVVLAWLHHLILLLDLSCLLIIGHLGLLSPCLL